MRGLRRLHFRCQRRLPARSVHAVGELSAEGARRSERLVRVGVMRGCSLSIGRLLEWRPAPWLGVVRLRCELPRARSRGKGCVVASASVAFSCLSAASVGASLCCGRLRVSTVGESVARVASIAGVCGVVESASRRLGGGCTRGACPRSACGSVWARSCLFVGYLVDPASSHMLVSKIKPCMSKYKRLYCETANGSLNQLWFI